MPNPSRQNTETALDVEYALSMKAIAGARAAALYLAGRGVNFRTLVRVLADGDLKREHCSTPSAPMAPAHAAAQP
jgi:hypothetical protein